MASTALKLVDGNLDMDEKLAQLTAVLYTPNPQLTHISSGGNEVYRLWVDGRPHYLRLSSIDFGNCGQHWFMWDIAISLSVVLWLPYVEQSQIRHWLLAGCKSMLPIVPEMLAELDWFLRLRMIYVYLSRLWWFGERPTSHQQLVLDHLRYLVHHPVTWDNVNAPSWRI
jgi:Ser/Thr protein kinase RdoA (MazF antagonist)